MIAVKPQHLGTLEWHQPSMLHRQFELRSGDSVLATLDFIKPLGSLAVARTASSAWTYKRTGFFSPKVTSRIEGSEQEIAIFEPNWSHSKGTIRLSDGSEVRLKSASIWQMEWILMDSADRELLRFHNKGVLRHGAQVDIAPAARERSDIMLLLTLVWYVLVLHMEDSAATAGA